MLAKSTGIVLRQVKYGETSLILDILTEDWGLDSFIVSGVRKKKSKNPPAIYQLMNWIELVAYYKNTKAIKRLKEAKISFQYQLLPFDPVRRCIGIFLLEVINKATRHQDKQEGLFQFIKECFVALDDKDIYPSNAHIWFLLKLSTFLGIEPHGCWSEETPYFHKMNGVFTALNDGRACSRIQSKAISDLRDSTEPLGGDITLHGDLRSQLIAEINQFYQYQIEKFPDFNTFAIFKHIF